VAEGHWIETTPRFRLKPKTVTVLLLEGNALSKDWLSTMSGR
jgi:hypothetical protein